MSTTPTSTNEAGGQQQTATSPSQSPAIPRPQAIQCASSLLNTSSPYLSSATTASSMGVPMGPGMMCGAVHVPPRMTPPPFVMVMPPSTSPAPLSSSTSAALLASPSLTPDPDTFGNVWSCDFLDFVFNDRSYASQLESTRLSTGRTAAISCRIRQINGLDVMWMVHEFRFIGGSLGCAEGELLCRGFEKAAELGIAAVVVAKSGGARMQEGTLALMQMAKVSAAVTRFKQSGLPYISVCLDPTYGGTTASYAMQGDIRIAVKSARIGFAGENVILNTVYKMDQAAYDRDCPPGFQTAAFVLQHGQVDLLIDDVDHLDDEVAKILAVLYLRQVQSPLYTQNLTELLVTDEEYQAKYCTKPADYHADYTKARRSDRLQTQDIIQQLFENYVELAGDGKVGYDRCIRGGLGLLCGRTPCMVVATFKGHEPAAMREANFGMAEPAGYRLACRLFQLAEHFKLPVVTLVDTPGAYPSFSSEVTGQPEAIATNLLVMAGLKVPIITIMVGEGGSGGALAMAVGDRIGMLSDGYYGVITPEGAASILCRYPNDEVKAKKFPLDCKAIAAAQKIYAEDLHRLGVVDHIIWESAEETYQNAPKTISAIREFIIRSLVDLSGMRPDELVERRYHKFRSLGQYSRGLATPSPLTILGTTSATKPSKPSMTATKLDAQEMVLPREVPGLLEFVTNTIVNGPQSVLFTHVPPDITITKRLEPTQVPALTEEQQQNTAKWVLDHKGADELVNWMKAQKRVMITDTTMRDAHQSVLATRVRTHDLLCVIEETAAVLPTAFSLEVWGGATFDVCVRYLHEDPWRRLRLLRQKAPNVCFQMLIRGSNAVGYMAYPENVIREFVTKSAVNGVDIFRIFDCFNDLDSMRVVIDQVRKCGKVAEVTMCFTGNFQSTTEKIYTLDYYTKLAKAIHDSGAHILGIKDMAGLFRPQMVEPFLAAIRTVTDLPIHFHTHNTSGGALATIVELAKNGCNVIDAAIASMSDTTSQPSLNAFLAAMEGHPRDPQINWLSLERLDLAWGNIRSQYFMHESGLKSGTARVFDHQIPGGQYSNLIAQCKSLGIWHRWGEVLDMYRDVNMLFGDVIKVTPSSKVVGDMALYLINKNLTCADVMAHGQDLDFPQSVVNMFKGNLGFPHHGFPERLTQIVLKGQSKVVKQSLPAADFVATRKQLQEKFPNHVFTEEDLVTALLYPKEYEEFCKFCDTHGDKMLMALPTYVFQFGLRIGASFDIEPLGDETAACDKHKVSVTLHRVGPLSNENMRTVMFQVEIPESFKGKKTVEMKVKETRDVKVESTTVLANPADKSQIPSPLPGVVDKIQVKPGQWVEKKTVLMTVGAMKMEVQVAAPFSGVVEKLCVQIGTKVDNKTLLLILKESPKQ